MTDEILCQTTLDPSSSYLVSSYANKSICMYDFLTGELVARAVGHGDTITGITFLPDCKHLVSVSYFFVLPGRHLCIFS